MYRCQLKNKTRVKEEKNRSKNQERKPMGKSGPHTSTSTQKKQYKHETKDGENWRKLPVLPDPEGFRKAIRDAGYGSFFVM